MRPLFELIILIGIIIISIGSTIIWLSLYNWRRPIHLLELKIRQLLCKHKYEQYGWGPLESQFEMCPKCWKVKK